MTTGDPHEEHYAARRRRVTPQNAAKWRAAAIGILSKRDRADLERVTRRLGNRMLIRYLAAEFAMEEAPNDALDTETRAACVSYSAAVEMATEVFSEQLDKLTRAKGKKP